MRASFLMSDISRKLRQRVDQKMRKVGLTRAQWFILHHIYHYDGITQQELADMVDMGKSSVTKQIASLESKGWIHRSENKSDGRSLRVYIAEKMKATVVNLNELAEVTLSPILERLEKEEITAIIKLLLKMNTHLCDDLRSDKIEKNIEALLRSI